MLATLEVGTDLDRTDRIALDTREPALRTVDRIALRVGLALLLWSGRRLRAVDPDAIRLRLEAVRQAEEERERYRRLARHWTPFM